MDFFGLKPLFIFEMANNHMGDAEHGLKIIREIHQICKDFDFKFGFKLQYRDLDTFIHPDYKDRKDIKYVKRFMETRLKEAEFKALKDEIKKLGFIAICTPFDENSVDLIVKHGYDIIKIGSCSFTDWPLLEKICRTEKPIIASTAGITVEDIDKVVSFFEHRKRNFAIMHCIGEYPTSYANLELNQVDLLKQRYPGVSIGFSTHEDPNNFDAIKIAAGKGLKIFERHVGVKTDKYSLNAYSSTPDQIYQWLKSAKEAYEMCGVEGKRRNITEKEKSDIRGLQRGVFAKNEIKKGEKIDLSNTFLAIPVTEHQITANDMSKYTEYSAESNIGKNLPVLSSNIKKIEAREKIFSIVQKVRKILHDSKILVPSQVELEISHHYGIDKFDEYGIVMVNIVNREYCKKLIVVLPGQKHPEQYHKVKEETFHLLYGDLLLNLDGVERELKAGEVITIEKGKKHAFSSKTGAVIEEISSTHFKEDSFYTDEQIAKNKNRKTFVTYWME